MKVGDKVRLKSWSGSEFYKVIKIDEKHVYLDIMGFYNFPYSVHHDWIIEKVITTKPFRRVLKPGRYGRVRISDTLQVRVEAVDTVEQLDEVIHTLNQIREVLSDV